MKAAGHSPETKKAGGGMLTLDLPGSVQLTAERVFGFFSLSYSDGQGQISDLWFIPLMAGLNPVLLSLAPSLTFLGNFLSCKMRTIVPFHRMPVRINTVIYIKYLGNAVPNTEGLSSSNGARGSSEAVAHRAVGPSVDSSQSMPGSVFTSSGKCRAL